MGLTRCNADGTQTALVPMNWSTPLISDANLAVFSTLTATVDVLPTETDLIFTWNGVTLSTGTPTSYSISYQDTSAERRTSGTGIGICGNGGSGSSDGMIIDDLVVSDFIAAPTFSSAGGALSGPLNVTINCATARRDYSLHHGRHYTVTN